jgi:hypothetical protein
MKLIGRTSVNSQYWAYCIVQTRFSAFAPYVLKALVGKKYEVDLNGQKIFAALVFALRTPRHTPVQGGCGQERALLDDWARAGARR